jgi:hypothetical protein
MKAFGQNSISSILRVVLNIAGVLLIIAFVLLGISAVAYGWAVYASFQGWLPIHNGRGTISLNGNPHDWPVVLAIVVAAALWLGGAFYIIGRLKKVFDSFRRNEPFHADNADHLRGIWIAMAIMEVLKLAIIAMALPLRAPSESFKFTPDLTGWFMVFVVMVFAEVFREGAKLRDEQNLTI